MSDANAKSSEKTSSTKKEVENTIDVRALEIVGGPMYIQSNELIMNPENVLDYTVEMVELVKSVGIYSKVIDENGKIIKRVDNKTNCVLDKTSIDKAIKKANSER